MDDYEETRLHELDPPPEERKARRMRLALSWVLYGAVALTVLACIYAIFFARR
jgi:hypothetical protein